MNLLKTLKSKFNSIVERLVIPERERDRFLIIFAGHVFFQTVYAGLKFDIFTLLGKEGPLTAQQLQEKLGVQKQPLRILLLGLVTAKVLKKKGELYANTRIASICLDRRSPRNESSSF